MRKMVAVAAILMLAIGYYFLRPPPPRPDGEHASGEHKHGGDPAAFVDGTVVSMDEQARTITIRHGPIDHFGLQATISTFQLAESSFAQQAKAGDMVRFQTSIATGAFTVTSIMKVN